MSYLAKYQPRNPANREHLDEMAKAAWHRQGIVCTPIDEIENEFLRRGMEEHMNEKFGKRK